MDFTILLLASRELNARRSVLVVRIQGDPNAEPFYLACGARRVGSAPSASIPNRELPLFEVALDGSKT